MAEASPRRVSRARARLSACSAVCGQRAPGPATLTGFLTVPGCVTPPGRGPRRCTGAARGSAGRSVTTSTLRPRLLHPRSPAADSRRPAHCSHGGASTSRARTPCMLHVIDVGGHARPPWAYAPGRGPRGAGARARSTSSRPAPTATESLETARGTVTFSESFGIAQGRPRGRARWTSSSCATPGRAPCGAASTGTSTSRCAGGRPTGASPGAEVCVGAWNRGVNAGGRRPSSDGRPWSGRPSVGGEVVAHGARRAGPAPRRRRAGRCRGTRGEVTAVERRLLRGPLRRASRSSGGPSRRPRSVRRGRPAAAGAPGMPDHARGAAGGAGRSRRTVDACVARRRVRPHRRPCALSSPIHSRAALAFHRPRCTSWTIGFGYFALRHPDPSSSLPGCAALTPELEALRRHAASRGAGRRHRAARGTLRLTCGHGGGPTGTIALETGGWGPREWDRPGRAAMLERAVPRRPPALDRRGRRTARPRPGSRTVLGPASVPHPDRHASSRRTSPGAAALQAPRSVDWLEPSPVGDRGPRTLRRQRHTSRFALAGRRPRG
jgi:hypothetical protein